MKRAFDLAAGALLALVFALPIAVLALLVRVTSRGPAFFRAERVGRGGRRFRIVKLRTMTDAPGPAIAAAGDVRVTAVGRVLRASRLDELPQLWNVLAGDMSLVGPRPEDPRFVDERDPVWRAVLSVRPGVTGPTQLAFAGVETADLGADPERGYRERVLPRKLASDAAYAASRSLGGDLAILVRTALFAAGVRR